MINPINKEPMKVQLVPPEAPIYLECLSDGGLIESETDAFNLVAACGENGVQRLLIHESNLTDAFFDLHTGLAGAALLKFSNYQIRVAAAIPSERAHAGRFGEMTLEARRQNHDFQVFDTVEDADAWLRRD